MRRISFIALLLTMVSCAASQARIGGDVHGTEGATKLVDRVHFAVGSARVLKSDMWIVENNAKWLSEHPGEVLVLEGHCDERGGDVFNLSLGDSRARAVKEAILAMGAMEESLIVISYGERKPADGRSNYDAWRMNRRVEFVRR